MKICENPYDTLQGEGKYIGVPTYFIRTAGCNLRCMFKDANGLTKCDTPYSSWKVTDVKTFDVNKALKTINEIGRKHICITGGEPLMHIDLSEIVDKLILNGNVVTIETNGTYYDPSMPEAFMSISPKLRSSYNQPADSNEAKMHERNNNFLEPTQKWITSHEYQLKFVINDDSDISEVLDIVDDLGADKSKVYLMPQGITKEQLQQKSQWLFGQCIEHGFNYAPRLHIDLFGNKQGI